MSLLSVKGLKKEFDGNAIFENVDLEVEKGETVFIIGSSGCGKSTFLRCLNRLNIPEKGEVYINGENIHAPKADLDRIRRSMGMVYQQFNLFSHLNILENVVLAPMKVSRLSKSDAISEAKKLLDRVGMGGREAAMPSALSGGQKQRVAIARALAMHPDIMLFDEPTSALDPTMIDEVESVIKDLCDDGMTSIIVTHEMQFVKNTASRVLFMAERGIYEQGTPDEIFNSPKKPLTRRFLYHSRMLELALRAEQLDLYSTASEIKRFLQRFQPNPRSEKLIPVIFDELLYPVFRSAESGVSAAELRLICSGTSNAHMLLITLPEIEDDPLSEKYVDSLNMQILEHFSEAVFSKENANGSGWEVFIQM